MPGQAYDTLAAFWRIQDSGDYTRLVDLFADDAVVEDVVHGTFRGRDAIMAFMTRMVALMGEAQIRFTLDELAGDDHVAWSRWTMHSPRGMHGGCGLYKVSHGKLTYYRDYVDPVE